MDIIFLKILFYILCFQFLFVAFFLFQNKKGKTLSNKLLAVVFFMISIAIINLYLIVFRVEINTPQILFVDDTFMFAYGPLLYLFTQSVLYKNYDLEKKHIIHFIPFIISICTVIFTILFVDSVFLSETTYQINSQQIPIYFHIGSILMLVHIFFYLFWSKQEISKVIDKVKRHLFNI